jgi:hypothetical protein
MVCAVPFCMPYADPIWRDVILWMRVLICWHFVAALIVAFYEDHHRHNTMATQHLLTILFWMEFAGAVFGLMMIWRGKSKKQKLS